ncbi:putative glutathione S transferase [Xylariaceae sp. FL1651]|nr:putative glutathione S transferase [Xylariaceae sp. FL1651]
MAQNNDSKPSYTLYVYVTRYSSWGARVQTVLEYFKIPYKVQYFNYENPALAPPADLAGGLLPVLDVSPGPGAPSSTAAGESLRIADSLSICEFLAEQHPDKALWPRDPQLRALARTAAAQMHSGFMALRNAYPSNFVARFTGPGIPFDDAIARDVRQLVELWSNLRVATKKRLAQLGEEDAGFLCGGFSVADAFFWPVLWRFRTYNVPLTWISGEGLEWMATMWSDPALKAQGNEYFRQAEDPQTKISAYDDLFENKYDVKSERFTKDWAFKGDRVSVI